VVERLLAAREAGDGEGERDGLHGLGHVDVEPGVDGKPRILRVRIGGQRQGGNVAAGMAGQLATLRMRS
jgi:hypothetical protein